MTCNRIRWANMQNQNINKRDITSELLQKISIHVKFKSTSSLDYIFNEEILRNLFESYGKVCDITIKQLSKVTNLIYIYIYQYFIEYYMQ